MIEMFVAVTIWLVIGGVLLLVLINSPWWLWVIVIAAIVLLLDKQVNQDPAADLVEEGD